MGLLYLHIVLDTQMNVWIEELLLMGLLWHDWYVGGGVLPLRT